MSIDTLKKQKGFTIIEVVLVLAIAGLIFLIVFLALPQLQRSRRDTQRRSDAGRVLSELENYASNNNGVYPTTQAQLDSFKNDYLGSIEVKDPKTGNTYTLTLELANSSAVTTEGEMSYSTSAKCNGQLMTSTSSARDVAIVVKIENGGTYCQDNQ